MYNQKKIIEIYNQISDDKIDKEDLLKILPKLYLIMNKVELDDIDLINIIDVLKEIRNLNLIDMITPEIIDLVNRITKNDKINLEGTLYFPVILKHVILPYNKNNCDKDYNLIVFLSEFEILIELINKMLNKKDIDILDKYNHELKEVSLRYKEARKLYDKYVINDVILRAMLSHFATMIYFNLDDYDGDYDLIIEILYNIISSYQEFIDYCCSLGIHKNFTRISNDLSGIEMEYIVSNDMLKHLYNSKKEEKKKRKC